MARVALAVQRQGHLVNLGDCLGVEDVPVLHDECHCDRRGAAKGPRKLVLCADVRMIGPLGSRDRVDLHRGSRQRIPKGGRRRIEDRVEEEPGRKKE